MFASFEREVHKRAAEGGDTTPDGLKQLWYELNRKYYGEAITIDEPLKMEWARIPHFYTPFYVYQYATGYSAATALASAILEQGEPATRRYLNFLTKGGSDYPIELLKGAGVDMSTPAARRSRRQAVRKNARRNGRAGEIAEAPGFNRTRSSRPPRRIEGRLFA